jgi:hypothetical protein
MKEGQIRTLNLAAAILDVKRLEGMSHQELITAEFSTAR